MNRRQELINKAQGLIDKNKIKEAYKVMNDIKALDNENRLNKAILKGVETIETN